MGSGEWCTGNPQEIYLMEKQADWGKGASCSAGTKDGSWWPLKKLTPHKAIRKLISLLRQRPGRRVKRGKKK